jgi:dodecin
LLSWSWAWTEERAIKTSKPAPGDFRTTRRLPKEKWLCKAKYQSTGYNARTHVVVAASLCRGVRALPPAPRHSAVSTTPISLIQAKLDFLLFSSVSLENNGQMSEHIYKKIELVGSSPNGFEEAVKNALMRAEKTVRNMRWFEVAETRGYIENGEIAHWQVTLKIGFTLEDA